MANKRKEMTAQEFEGKTGSPPIEDELERVNCPRVGIAGHRNCGWCDICDNPAFSCECREYP